MSHQTKVITARIFYAMALIAFGVQHILFDDFIAGRAPSWPQAWPGQIFWAYATGLILIMAGLAVILDRKSRLALLISGLLILGWAAFRNLFALAMEPQYGGLLTNLFKSLSLGGGAFIVARSFSTSEFSITSGEFISRMSSLGVYFVGGFLLVGGIQHFIFVDFVKFLVPTWIPGNVFWTYFAGIALVASGVGIIFNILRYLASMLASFMVFAWVILLHVPRAIEIANQNEWTAVFEALAISGILMLISESSKKRDSH